MTPVSTSLQLRDILSEEWKPAYGCTEPAAVAWAAAHAALAADDTIQSIHLRCDPRTYKNCYAVGLPVPGKQIGILWALAIGANLPNPSLGLESFSLANEAIVHQAKKLLDQNLIEVHVDPDLAQLFVEVTVTTPRSTGRATIEHSHSFLKSVERNGIPLPIEQFSASSPLSSARDSLATLTFSELWNLSENLDEPDRVKLRDGIDRNLKIAEHGCSLLPEPLKPDPSLPLAHQIPAWVGAGVRARMSGETLSVMSLSGSGNKGITVTVAITLWGRAHHIPEATIERALAFGILLTAVATHQLGTLSSICGAANAAGIAISGAIVMMMGGSPQQVELAIHNMVGNLAGMICDGAKIGCSMKTMTGVEAAIRSAKMALANVHLSESNGIVGHDGHQSLANLGRLAQFGMSITDREILSIMQDKLKRHSANSSCNGIGKTPHHP